MKIFPSLPKRQVCGSSVGGGCDRRTTGRAFVRASPLLATPPISSLESTGATGAWPTSGRLHPVQSHRPVRVSSVGAGCIFERPFAPSGRLPTPRGGTAWSGYRQDPRRSRAGAGCLGALRLGLRAEGFPPISLLPDVDLGRGSGTMSTEKGGSACQAEGGAARRARCKDVMGGPVLFEPAPSLACAAASCRLACRRHAGASLLAHSSLPLPHCHTPGSGAKIC